MNTLGLHTFAIAPVWDIALIEAEMERIRSHGVGLFEIPLLRPEEIDVAGTLAFSQRHGVEVICSLGLPGWADVVDRPDDVLAFLTPAFEVTRSVGSASLSGVTYGTIGRTSGSAPSERELDGMCRFLERAAKQAAAHGLKLGIEPCNRYETHLMNRGSDAVAIIERVGADNIFIHLDTYHMNLEEESFDAGFRAAAPYLGYVHVSEANRGVPGRGQINWDAAFAAIARIGYNGPLTLESMNHVDKDIAGGLAIWRPVADNPDDVIDAGLPFLRQAAERAGLQLG
uniref:sugar phosphate isomerase/epimerase family protein n=1 Tax=Pararhizobium sp. IMCC3301 TaxID=3067904 RepID=UPI0027408CE8|nr:sugar phosphate isomerase/epimerase [Pararhizobium sp. IMCC3301]